MKRNLTYATICTLGLGLLFMIQDVNGALTVKPENYGAVKGDNFILRCQTNQTYNLQWNGCFPGSTKEAKMIVHSGYNSSLYAANFSKLLQVVDGEFSLGITAMREAAMSYECLEPRSLESRWAVVTVLESHPICHMTNGSGFVEITCGINYWGDWAPALEWVACDGSNITANVSSFKASNNRVTSSITLRQNSSFCLNLTARFKENGRPSITDAENIPSYSHTISFYHSMEDNSNTTAYIGLVIFVVVMIIVVGVVISLGYHYRARLEVLRQIFCRRVAASQLTNVMRSLITSLENKTTVVYAVNPEQCHVDANVATYSEMKQRN